MICRARYNSRVARMVARARARGIPVLFDCDDLVFDVGHVHLLVDSLNLDQSSEAVWDGWFAYMARIGATLRLCDAFVTTNAYLAERALEYQPRLRTAIVPNYLNPQQQELSQGYYRAKQNSGWARDGRIHIGYFSGSPTHARDFAIVAPAICRLLARDPRIVLRITGFLDPDQEFGTLPDVAAAVGSGAIKSGAEHFLRYGIREERLITKGAARSKPLQFPFPTGCWPTRRDRLLTKLDLRNMSGLEIGALASPLVKPSEGSIFFVDHADTQEIRSKYAKDKSVNPESIVAVDAIWGEKTLQQCIGHDKRVDYVLASHVVEYVPDLVTWLAEIHEVLKNDGSLRLAVPDRRYTFDYLRNESRLSDVLEAYLLKARRPLPRFVIEHCHMARVVDIASAWRGNLDARELQPMGSVASGIEVAKDSNREWGLPRYPLLGIYPCFLRKSVSSTGRTRSGRLCLRKIF